jgi:hypothetical protein
MPAIPWLVWAGLAGVGLWSAARIVEAVTDDPDVPNDPPSLWPLYAALALAGVATWWAIRK